MTQKSDYARIVELWNKGLPVEIIRRRLGVATSTVTRALLEAGIERGKNKQRRYDAVSAGS